MSLRGAGGGFPARFQGWCDSCDYRIEVDELITSAGNGRFVHAECPEVVPEKPTRFQGTSLEEMGF